MEIVSPLGGGKGTITKVKKLAPGRLEKRFWVFHKANPQVYSLLVTLSRQWRKAKGPRSQLSIAMLFERSRWEFAIATITTEEFKLSNSHRAYYARLIMEQESDLRGLFILRKLTTPCTFGPRNAELPDYRKNLKEESKHVS
jgi:hypothetical protein